MFETRQVTASCLVGRRSHHHLDFLQRIRADVHSPTLVTNVAIVEPTVGHRAVGVCRSYSGARIVPETAELKVMMSDTVIRIGIVVLVVCAELLIVVVQKTLASSLALPL